MMKMKFFVRCTREPGRNVEGNKHNQMENKRVDQRVLGDLKEGYISKKKLSVYLKEPNSKEIWRLSTGFFRVHNKQITEDGEQNAFCKVHGTEDKSEVAKNQNKEVLCNNGRTLIILAMRVIKEDKGLSHK